MGLLDKITGIPGKIKKANAKRVRDQERREDAIIRNREKHLPRIQRIARKFNARVDALDTAAYIYKNIGKREVGVHVQYGTPDLLIERKLKVAFTKSATGSKIIKGITNAAHKAKALREDLSEAGAAIKGAMGDGKGNMYDDPNFGKGFR